MIYILCNSHSSPEICVLLFILQGCIISFKVKNNTEKKCVHVHKATNKIQIKTKSIGAIEMK